MRTVRQLMAEEFGGSMAHEVRPVGPFGKWFDGFSDAWVVRDKVSEQTEKALAQALSILGWKNDLKVIFGINTSSMPNKIEAVATVWNSGESAELSPEVIMSIRRELSGVTGIPVKVWKEESSGVDYDRLVRGAGTVLSASILLTNR